MFSHASKMPFEDIREVRPCMTSFAAQIVQRELVVQASEAVRPESGLHVHIPTQKRPFKANASTIDWRNLGLQTHATIGDIHRKKQPLLWTLLWSVADPRTLQTKQSTKETRERRPIEPVRVFFTMFYNYFLCEILLCRLCQQSFRSLLSAGRLLLALDQ